MRILYSDNNFVRLASLLIKTWGLDEAVRRAKGLCGKNPQGARLLTLLDDVKEVLG